jgi:hypothetical protein
MQFDASRCITTPQVPTELELAAFFIDPSTFSKSPFSVQSGAACNVSDAS